MTHLSFVETGVTKSGLTKIWAVNATHGAIQLGRVFWFAAWRRYCFAPCADTVFDTKCLDEIQVFLVKCNEEHKAAK